MRDLAGTRVLVTGSAGVIGRELIRRLAESGAHVLSVDRLGLHEPVQGDVVHNQVDLAEADLGFIGAFRPQILFHLAASFERSAETADFWPTNWHDNVLASHRVVDAASACRDLEAFVFASSYLVYAPSLYLRTGRAPARPATLPEDAPLDPRNLCGAAKLYTERELDFLQTVMGLPLRTVSARIFRVYGRGSRDVISRWTRSALRGETLDVYRPENRFDYVYAGDVAEGLLRLGAASTAEGAVNLATGQARQIEEVLTGLGRLATPRELRRRDRQTDDPYEASCADISRLRKVTRWSPPTRLEDGMKAVWDYEEGRRAGA